MSSHVQFTCNAKIKNFFASNIRSASSAVVHREQKAFASLSVLLCYAIKLNYRQRHMRFGHKECTTKMLHTLMFSEAHKITTGDFIRGLALKTVSFL